MQFAKEEVKKRIIGVNRICELCGISKATFYNAKDPEDRLLEKYVSFKKYVEKVIALHPCYGIRRIKEALFQEHTITIGRDVLGKLLILWGLSLKRKIRKREISLIQKILILLSHKTNLLIRSAIAEPLQAITSDISKITYNNGKSFCYLATHKDVFGQMVYGHKVLETMEASLVIESFRLSIKAIRKLIGQTPKKPIFHQDQGSQYTSYEYVDEALKYGTLSYSTKGTPTDNAGQESFFGRFKDEWQDELNEITSFKEVKKFIKNKIAYYNNKRLHTSIGYRTPSSYTKSILKSLKSEKT